ncbi:hypothetical protein IJH02_02510 [Candidatus Saccharibacteria bacterium]|nr:hypothetical protein [Candidatus Saccharibacteria bacterium]
MNPIREIYDLTFKRKETFDDAMKIFHENVDGTLEAWREKGFKDAVEQWDFGSALGEMSLEEIAEEHLGCAEEIEWTEKFVERAIRRKVKVGLFWILAKNIACLALIVTAALVFGFGFHPFIIAITIGILAIGFLPYLAASWFYDGRLLDAHYDLGWNKFEMAQLQAFWKTVICVVDNMADLESSLSP